MTFNPSKETSMKFALVNNVNTERSRVADFDIHAEGCRDLGKVAPMDIEIVEADNAQGVIAYNVDDLEASGFDRESAEMFTHNVKPCAC